MKKVNRTVSALLSILLVLSMIPFASFAAGGDITGNIANYRLDANVIAPDQWSYVEIDNETAKLLDKGAAPNFDTDQWVKDNGDGNKTRSVKANGDVYTALLKNSNGVTGFTLAAQDYEVFRQQAEEMKILIPKHYICINSPLKKESLF